MPPHSEAVAGSPISKRLADFQPLVDAHSLPVFAQALQNLIFGNYQADYQLHFTVGYSGSASGFSAVDQVGLPFCLKCEAQKTHLLAQLPSDDIFIAVFPLISHAEVIGSVLLRRQGGPFTESETTGLDSTFQFIAPLLQLLLLQERLNFQQKALGLIASVTSQLAHISQLDELTQEVCASIRAAFGYYYVAVFTVEPHSDQLRFRASSSASQHGQPLFETLASSQLRVGEHLVGHVAQTGQTLLANDVSREPRYFAVDALFETRSELAIPLQIGELTEGVLDFQSDQLNAFSEDDLLVLSALAASVAIAIHRVRLYAEIKGRNEELDLIAQVSESIASILDVEQLLKRVTELIHQEFHYPYVHIFLYHYLNDSLEFATGSGDRAEYYQTHRVSFRLKSSRGLIAKAGRTRSIQCANDVTSAPAFLPNPKTSTQFGSELSLPLIFGDNLLGVLDIQSDRTGDFDHNDIEVLSTLSSSVSIALRNANLYKSEIWRRQVAESLRDVAVLLSRNISMADLFQALLQKIQLILPTDCASIWLLDSPPEDEAPARPPQLRLKSYRGNQPKFELENPAMACEPDCWLMQALLQDEPLVHQDAMMRDPIMNHFQWSNSCSGIAAPLLAGGQKLGLLVLHEHSPRRYGEDSRSICASFAGYLSIALENEALSAESADQAWVSTLLLQVALATQSLTTLAELAETIGQLVMLLIGGKSGGLAVLNPENQAFYLENLFGSGTEKLHRKLPLELPACPELRFVTENRQVFALPAGDFNPLVTALLQCADQDAVLLFPLVAHNEPVGVLIHISDEPYQPAEPEAVLGRQRFAILRGIAQQAATSMQNIKLLEARQEEAYVSSALLQLSKISFSSSDLSTTLDLLSGALPVLSGAEGLAILEFREETQDYIVLNLISPRLSRWQAERLKGSKFPAAYLPTPAEFSPARPLVIYPAERYNDLNQIFDNLDGVFDAESDRPSDPDSEIIFIPLAVQGKTYGWLVARDPVKPKREHRQELLIGAAQQITAAMQNAHLRSIQDQQQQIDREFQLARYIQRTFLPENLPEIQGYSLSVQWDTARQVGGDFYDVFELKPGFTGLVIADVSDKGLPAALYMTVSQTLIRAAAAGSFSPAAVLEQVNHQLQIDSSKGFFVTAFYGILEQQTGLLRYSIAGHNPPFLLRSAGRTVSPLPRGGIALGIADGVSLPEASLQIEREDALLLYTDGISEAVDAKGRFYGTARLQRCLRRCFGLSAPEILEKVKADLNRFRGEAPLSDDITQVVLRREGSLTN